MFLSRNPHPDRSAKPTVEPLEGRRLLHAGHDLGGEAAGEFSATYEAEQAVLGGAKVTNVFPGYSGTGFVDFINASGDSAEFVVNVPEAGGYALRFRHANGSTAARAMQLQVNGSTVAGGVSFVPTGSWSAWGGVQKTVQLAAGANRVRLVAAGQSGPNLDALEVHEVVQEPPPAGPATYQAESAARGGVVVSTIFPGYTGSGFVDYVNAANDFVEFTVNAASAGNYALDFRYANGSAAARGMELRVNGAVRAGGISFGRTTSWQDWRTVTVAASLNAGANTIRLSAAGQSGPNLDALTVRPADAQPPPTDTFTQIRWTELTPAPVPRAEAFHAEIGGKLYVFGGFSGDGGQITGPVARADVYDPVTDTWRRIADLPRRLSHVGTASDGRYAYLAGGYVGVGPGPGWNQVFATKEVWRYDPVANQYTRLPDLPDARGSGGLVLLGRELHFFGGSRLDRLDAGEHWVLNLDGGTTWHARAPMPNPRSHMGYAALGGRIYAVGGERGHDEALVPQDTVNVYDPATDTWGGRAPLPRTINHIANSTLVMGGRIITLGGQINHDQSIADVYAYDPGANRWAPLSPLPVKSYSAVAAVIDNVIYVAGGSGGLARIWKGTPVA